MSDDLVSFEALYRATRVPLLAYVRRRVRAEDAPDLLAELYLLAWRKRDRMPAGEEQRLWLYGVARRLVAEHWRTSEARAVETDSATGADASDRCGEIRDRAVATALASLPEVDRELVTLTTWDGLSTASAARVLGLAPGAGRVRLHRARARLAGHPALRQLMAETAGRDDAVPGDVSLELPLSQPSN